MIFYGLGRAMSHIREQKGLKQEDAAYRAGVDPSNWSKWETGERHPQRRQLEKITTGLDCRETELGLIASRYSFDHYAEKALAEGIEVEDLTPQVVDRLAELELDDLPLKFRPVVRALRDAVLQATNQLIDLYHLVVAGADSET